MTDKQKAKAYWKKNLKYGILLVEQLNTIRIGGFKLGFWFAQQGAIYVFVILIFVYIRLMNRLDKKFNLDE